MRSDPENLLSLIEKVNHWLVCKRWKKVIYGAISVQKRKKSSVSFFIVRMVFDMPHSVYSGQEDSVSSRQCCDHSAMC